MKKLILLSLAIYALPLFAQNNSSAVQAPTLKKSAGSRLISTEQQLEEIAALKKIDEDTKARKATDADAANGIKKQKEIYNGKSREASGQVTDLPQGGKINGSGSMLSSGTGSLLSGARPSIQENDITLNEGEYRKAIYAKLISQGKTPTQAADQTEKSMARFKLAVSAQNKCGTNISQQTQTAMKTVVLNSDEKVDKTAFIGRLKNLAAQMEKCDEVFTKDGFYGCGKTTPQGKKYSYLGPDLKKLNSEDCDGLVIENKSAYCLGITKAVGASDAKVIVKSSHRISDDAQIAESSCAVRTSAQWEELGAKLLVPLATTYYDKKSNEASKKDAGSK